MATLEQKALAWMRWQVQLGEYIGIDGVELTQIAEGACSALDAYGPPPAYDIPEEFFEWAFVVGEEFSKAQKGGV